MPAPPSLLAHEDYVALLAAADEAGDRSAGVALEDLARARLAGREENVGQFGLDLHRRAAIYRAIKPAALLADDVFVVRRGAVAPDIGVGQRRRQFHCRRILAQRESLHLDELPGAAFLAPGAGGAIERVQPLAVEVLVLVIQIG